jgi:hypothetical protein
VNDERSSRWLIWTGPLYAVIFIVFAFVVEGDTPGEKASGAQVMDYYNSHQGRSMIGVFGAPLIALLLVLFAAAVRSRAERSGAGSAASATMFGGALLWAAGILLGSAIDLGLVSSSDHHQSDVARTLNVLSNADWVPFIAGIAVFLFGCGLTVLTTHVLPAWLGWVALAVGVVALAGPGGFAGFFVGPLWILIAGIVLGLRRTDAAPTAAPNAPTHAAVNA